jgi:CO/xanthine dehydrogenase Mo-binding subunit/aerobic-type carbon monoxide dehydrogenase small subunit (CoxS/CutS family)
VIEVNNHLHDFNGPAETTLLQWLNQAGFRDVRRGCAEGVCGACSVLLDGKPAASCLLLAAQAEGRKVVTAGGLHDGIGIAHPERTALLIEHLTARQTFQCGYCACGMLVAAAACLDENANASVEQIRDSLAGNLCRCTGYTQIVEAIAAAAAGEPAPPPGPGRDDMAEKLNGAAHYPTDVAISDALAGRILWSEFPHARIVSIDTNAAKRIPGVEVVLTAKDIPGKNSGGITIFRDDQPVLATELVRSMGDAVALVAARDDLTARAALKAIRVEYQPLPAVHDVLEAVKSDAPKIWPSGNLLTQSVENLGDIDAGFREARLIIEETYRCEMVDHACMEIEGGTASIENGLLTLSVPTQTPHAVRSSVARVLGISESAISVSTPRMGGSFGRHLIPHQEAHLALLCHATGKPVRLEMDRLESLARGPKRHPFAAKYRLGVNRDGAFTALEVEVFTDAGPYMSLTPVIALIFATEASGGYAFPNLKVTTKAIATNNLPAAPLRGFGSQQVNYGIECIVEKAAHALSMDPGAIRRKNFLQTQSDGTGGEIPGSMSMLPVTLDWVQGQLGARPVPPPGWLAGRGLGVVHAKYCYPFGLVDRFTARLLVNAEGKFTLESDVADAGSGGPLGAAQLVAQALGLSDTVAFRVSQLAVDDPSGAVFCQGKHLSAWRSFVFRAIEWVQILLGARPQALTGRISATTLSKLLRLGARPINFLSGAVARFKSAVFPYGIDSFNPRTSGSRGIAMLGMAAMNAVEALKHSALLLASDSLGLLASQLTIDGQGVTGAGRRLTWVDLAKSAGGSLASVGEASLPRGFLFDPKTGNQIGPVDFAIATHGCDLIVHPETGEVRIVRYFACHDVGHILNREAIRGQILGGIALGLGQALFERIPTVNGVYDPSTACFHDYLLPTILDVPKNVEIMLLESNGGVGPRRSKGVGEPGAVAAPIAVMNALYDALGAQILSVPVTPAGIVDRVNV